MADTRREFVKKSFLLAGAASLNDLSPLKENLSPTPEGDRLVLLGTQGGPFIRSYKQTPAANLVVYRNTPYIYRHGPRHTVTSHVHQRCRENRHGGKSQNLVLNHFIPPDDQTLTEQFWIDAVKKNYSGNSIVGKDLLSLPL